MSTVSIPATTAEVRPTLAFAQEKQITMLGLSCCSNARSKLVVLQRYPLLFYEKWQITEQDERIQNPVLTEAEEDQ